MITEDYCSYEVAKLLKEKGFDENTEHKMWYVIKQFSTGCQWNSCTHKVGDITREYNNDCCISMPTHQMAMKWLREVHKIFIVIIPRLFYSDGSCDSFAYSIWADDNLDVDGEEEWDELYESYEDAVEAALKYSLERLI